MDILIVILTWAIPVLFAITLHEAAHGWVADRLGDPTARGEGRISINPFNHIDPMGTVVIPIMTLLTVGVAFGAAKPVPVRPENFRSPYLDMALVAVAGPLSNLIMAMFWGGLVAVSINLVEDVTLGEWLFSIGQAGVAINLIIMALNLLPIPPLDGSKIVAGILPKDLVSRYIGFERYGFFVLVALIAVEVVSNIPVFSTLLFTLVNPFMGFIEGLFNFQGIYF